MSQTHGVLVSRLRLHLRCRQARALHQHISLNLETLLDDEVNGVMHDSSRFLHVDPRRAQGSSVAHLEGVVANCADEDTGIAPPDDPLLWSLRRQDTQQWTCRRSASAAGSNFGGLSRKACSLEW